MNMNRKEEKTEWPMLLDMTREECFAKLRSMELLAYHDVVQVLRAQGSLTPEKKQVLKDLADILDIPLDWHKTQCRMAYSNEKLATIAEFAEGPDTDTDWIIEGRRLVPVTPRLAPHTIYTARADRVAKLVAERNALLPPPCETSRFLEKKIKIETIKEESLSMSFSSSNSTSVSTSPSSSTASSLSTSPVPLATSLSKPNVPASTDVQPTSSDAMTKVPPSVFAPTTLIPTSPPVSAAFLSSCESTAIPSITKSTSMANSMSPTPSLLVSTSLPPTCSSNSLVREIPSTSPTNKLLTVSLEYVSKEITDPVPSLSSMLPKPLTTSAVDSLNVNTFMQSFSNTSLSTSDAPKKSPISINTPPLKPATETQITKTSSSVHPLTDPASIESLEFFIPQIEATSNLTQTQPSSSIPVTNDTIPEKYHSKPTVTTNFVQNIPSDNRTTANPLNPSMDLSFLSNFPLISVPPSSAFPPSPEPTLDQTLSSNNGFEGITEKEKMEDSNSVLMLPSGMSIQLHDDSCDNPNKRKHSQSPNTTLPKKILTVPVTKATFQSTSTGSIQNPVKISMNNQSFNNLPLATSPINANQKVIIVSNTNSAQNNSTIVQRSVNITKPGLSRFQGNKVNSRTVSVTKGRPRSSSIVIPVTPTMQIIPSNEENTTDSTMKCISVPGTRILQKSPSMLIVNPTNKVPMTSGLNVRPESNTLPKPQNVVIVRQAQPKNAVQITNVNKKLVKGVLSGPSIPVKKQAVIKKFTNNPVAINTKRGKVIRLDVSKGNYDQNATIGEILQASGMLPPTPKPSTSNVNNQNSTFGEIFQVSSRMLSTSQSSTKKHIECELNVSSPVVQNVAESANVTGSSETETDVKIKSEEDDVIYVVPDQQEVNNVTNSIVLDGPNQGLDDNMEFHFLPSVAESHIMQQTETDASSVKNFKSQETENQSL
uniref:ENT domain-containing protein n=1 Tax=Clastoptera arizonana TaxID=38151 RepID=A0A1B6CXF2_9HEMI